MASFLKMLGSAGNAIQAYHDASAKRAKADYEMWQARNAINQQQIQNQSQAGFGKTILDIFGGDQPPGVAAAKAAAPINPGAMTPGINPGAPSPQNPPIGAPHFSAGPMARAMPQPPSMAPGAPAGPAMNRGMAQPAIVYPGGVPQGPMTQPAGGQMGMPAQGGQGGYQGLDWRMIAQAIRRQMPNADPQVVAGVVDKYIPFMSTESKLAWQQAKIQQEYMNAIIRQNLGQGRLDIQQQNADTAGRRADAATTAANASASRAATYGSTQPVMAQAAQTRADAAATQARKARDWGDPSQRPAVKAPPQTMPAQQKIQLQGLIQADRTAAQNYRSILNAKMGDANDPDVKAAQQEMQRTGQALAEFTTGKAAKGGSGQMPSQGWQPPAGAPDPSGQADGAVLQQNGVPVAKAMGGKWVQP